VRLRFYEFFLLPSLAFLASTVTACSDGGEEETNGGDPSGTGGTGATGGSGFGASSFNQCGVAAPLPTDTGQCAAVTAPKIADFDDYSGTAAGSYTFYINGAPPAEGALLGAILHVGDGSDASGGTSVIATEMVTGEGDAGYALEISNTNATNWGGLLMFYFPYSGTTVACLDAREQGGVAFSIKGNSASGRFGVTLGMLDTTPSADNGFCNNPTTADCKEANIEFRLPADPEAWTRIEVPWSAFTPGIGSNTACVPVTGQNVMRLVIQPFMNYPPPNYMFEPGAYAIVVDNVAFY
jgi:hypothetical protein